MEPLARGRRESRELAKRAPRLQTLNGGVSRGAAGHSRGGAVRKPDISSSELDIHLVNTSIVAPSSVTARLVVEWANQVGVWEVNNRAMVERELKEQD